MSDGVNCSARDQRDPVAVVALHPAEQECAEECFLDECYRNRGEEILRNKRNRSSAISNSAARRNREPEQNYNRDHRDAETANGVSDTAPRQMNKTSCQ